MKKIYLLPILIFVLFISACAENKEIKNPDSNKIIVDSSGNAAKLPENPVVISCYGSYSECWLLSGGKLLGVTDDAIKERNLPLGENVKIVGTVKDINLEEIISLNPDYVILSEEIASHSKIKASLGDMGIAYGSFKMDSFSDYEKIMKEFTDFNERDDLYQENVLNVSDNIKTILEKAHVNSDKTFLLMRAYSTGIKVKTDNIAEDIIKDFNIISLADKSPSLLDNLSVEHIISQDPDYIFVLTMGNEESAKKYLSEYVENNPAWNSLSAVKNGNYIILPKELFHYKPNNRWDDSYEYIAKILCQ